MSWYTPATNPEYAGPHKEKLTERKGYQIGPFILIKLNYDAHMEPTDPYWQIDHWPTGFALKRQVPYHKARTWMSRHADDPFWRFETPPARDTAHWQHLKRQYDELYDELA